MTFGSVGFVQADSPSELSKAQKAESIEFFEAKIRPVLVNRCFACHSGDAKKLKGGLRLDSRALMLAGGDTGAAIVPGDPDKSLLIDSIRYDARSYQMPPDGKLSEGVIANFETWVRSGAVWPDGEGAVALRPQSKTIGSISEEQRSFWSFQALKVESAPDVSDSDWPVNGIDQFILSRLEAENHRPAERATRTALIRRATFDLLGLPPTPEEIDAFIADSSPSAFSRLVDRLLDSPRYGERWARHWLDGVRYASDVGYYNFSDLGWPYRDWVVRALNDDIPYDQFVVHQIAGDLLPIDADLSPIDSDRAYADGIAATGVLAMGNLDDQESAKEVLYAGVIDDQIDLVSRQFLGLTVSCARCHDHKFDPILQEDYYALGGIFMSSRVLKTESRIGAPRLTISMNRPGGGERRKTIEERIRQTQEKIAKRIPDDASGESLVALRTQIDEWRNQLPRDFGQTIGIREGGHEDGRHNKIGDMPIYIRGNPHKLGRVVPRRFPRVIAGDDQQPIGERTTQSGRLELARWIASSENPLTARVMINRIWQNHFGHGLVRTPSDFGSRGERPTHPKLLDYMADRFVRSGWSLKAMHRWIMNSATYQQSTIGDVSTSLQDPENRLLGRFSTRRLSAEEIYDSLLAVSRRLQPGLGQGKANRALYARVGQTHSFLVQSLFDAPAPGTIVSARGSSTTAPQALYMMNDEAVIAASKGLARRIAGAVDGDEAQVAIAYRIAYGRKASAEEIRVGRAYLAELPADKRWTYFQVLLCANEFMFLD